MTQQTTINPAIADAFVAAINAAKKGGSTALRVLFHKADGSLRTMDVACDEHMGDSLKGTQSAATLARNATNSVRKNVVVRERLGQPGNYSFQWRTIPACRIVSISPIV